MIRVLSLRFVAMVFLASCSAKESRALEAYMIDTGLEILSIQPGSRDETRKKAPGLFVFYEAGKDRDGYQELEWGSFITAHPDVPGAYGASCEVQSRRPAYLEIDVEQFPEAVRLSNGEVATRECEVRIGFNGEDVDFDYEGFGDRLRERLRMTLNANSAGGRTGGMSDAYYESGIVRDIDYALQDGSVIAATFVINERQGSELSDLELRLIMLPNAVLPDLEDEVYIDQETIKAIQEEHGL